MAEILVPATLADHLRENVISYLRTTFNVKNQGFSSSFDQFVRSSNGLFRGPYVDVKLPFKVAESPSNEMLDVSLQFRPFVHQEKAFERISSKQGFSKSTLVVTGTGSGKTECFLFPLLDPMLSG